MSYDLTDETASNGKPQGKFNLRVLSAKLKQSKAGEDMFSIEFAILGIASNKLRIYDNFMLEGKGAKMGRPKLAYLMDQAGVPRDAINDSSPWLNKVVCGDIGQKDGRNVAFDYFPPMEETETDEAF